jgi:hypothetical protein
VIVASHQPAYLPWLGYFDKLIRSDVFVVSDDVQYTRSDYFNRNYVKTANGRVLLTVPVSMQSNSRPPICELRLASVPWQQRHLATVQAAYRRAPCFDELWPELQALYSRPATHLHRLCFDHLAFWLDWLGVQTTIKRASELSAQGTKSERVLSICNLLSATSYLAGAGARDYLDVAAFERSGVAVSFQNYKPVAYTQLYGAFEPRLGVVDLAMNVPRNELVDVILAG